MVKINGSSFPHQYRRTNSFPIDSTETWTTIEDATAYARNTDTESYLPYSGQVISIEGEQSIYVLVEDDSISKEDGREHFKLHKISTEEIADGKYLSNILSYSINSETGEENQDEAGTYSAVTRDTDGDGLEDGYEIWDFKTKWNTETEDSTETEPKYVQDSDGLSRLPVMRSLNRFVLMSFWKLTNCAITACLLYLAKNGTRRVEV